MKISTGLESNVCLKLSQLLSRILGDTYVLAAKMARAVAEIAAKSEDQVTANMLADLGNGHEKTAWMLRSYLESSK